LAEHTGGDELTEREIEVLRLIAAGNTNKAIAAANQLRMHFAGCAYVLMARPAPSWLAGHRVGARASDDDSIAAAEDRRPISDHCTQGLGFPLQALFQQVWAQLRR